VCVTCNVMQAGIQAGDCSSRIRLFDTLRSSGVHSAPVVAPLLSRIVEACVACR
jgi:hypothetical protein